MTNKTYLTIYNYWKKFFFSIFAADKSIEKCIYEVLSFGTILGLLEPADDKGMMFRVASDIALFQNTNKNDQASEQPLELHGLDDCTEEKYCDC